jgi:predicted Zn finger-like uncharacterized protein
VVEGTVAMKFSCGECQAKYQIPDERVAGRKLKIRCRKCGAAISLRGDPTVEGLGIPAAAPSNVVEWHVSIEGDQHGPYLTEQMASMLRAGQLGWEAHVWREGYGDWKTADESDTLVHAVASIGSTTSDSMPALRATSGIAPYDDDELPTAMKAAPEEQEEPTLMAVNGAVVGQQQPLQPQARSAFAARASAARQTSAPPVFTGPPALGANVRQLPVSRSPRVSAAQAMTAQRNEDSVLFSANNLVPSSTQQQAAPVRPGYAAAEGSGLIDIRALAALAHSHRQTVQPDSAAASPYAGQGRDQVSYNVRADEPLPAIAHQAGTFARIDSLSPIERAPSRASNAVPFAILGGSAMIALAAFLAVYLTQQPAQVAPTAVTAPVAEPTAEPTAAEPAQQPGDEPKAEPEAAPAAEAKAAAAEPREPADDEPAAAEPSHARGAKGKAARSAKVSAKVAAATKTDKGEKLEKADKAASASAKTADEPAAEKEKPSIDDLLLDDKVAAKPAAPEPAKAKDSGKSRSIDELLDVAVEKKDKVAAAPAADSSLPELPSRDDVLGTMHAITPDVKACADGQNLTEATTTVAITVTGTTGHVQSVRVTGNQGAVGTCIAKVVRGATFPKFSKPSTTINYPFKLK